MHIVPSQQRVLAGGVVAATVGDQYLITGCAFTVPIGKPQPCVTVKFQPATKVLLSGQFAVLRNSSGICQSAEQIPQGPPVVTATQTKVLGT